MITKDDFQRIPSDSNGNPRYTLPFYKMLTPAENEERGREELAMARARQAGGTKLRKWNYAIFSSYNLQEECDILNDLLERALANGAA